MQELRQALIVALESYEETQGRINEKNYPDHWTVKARKALFDRSDPSP